MRQNNEALTSLEGLGALSSVDGNLLIQVRVPCAGIRATALYGLVQLQLV